jgi:hypothetical protein
MKGNPKDRFVIPIIVSLSIIVPIAVASLFLLPEDWKLQFGNANFRSLPFFSRNTEWFHCDTIASGLWSDKNKECCISSPC